MISLYSYHLSINKSNYHHESTPYSLFFLHRHPLTSNIQPSVRYTMGFIQTYLRETVPIKRWRRHSVRIFILYFFMTLLSSSRSIWETHLIMIRKHNLEADVGLHTYTLGINQFSDMVHLHRFSSPVSLLIHLPRRMKNSTHRWKVLTWAWKINSRINIVRHSLLQLIFNYQTLLVGHDERRIDWSSCFFIG